MKRLVYLLAFSAVIFSLPFTYRRAVCGFRVGKLMFAEISDSHPPLCDIPPDVQSIFGRPFTYLSHGAQSFVFASEDGQYILKIFRRSIRPHPWRTHLRKWALSHRKKMHPTKRDQRLLNACALAYEHARDLTGLAAVHLTSTNSTLPPATLIDPLGRAHRVDLNRCLFALQYRGRSVRDVLLDLAQAQAREQFLHCTKQFLSLLKSRTDRHLANSDTKIGSNFGFLSDRAIEWDFGNYWIDEELWNTDHQWQEIGLFAEHFQSYAKRIVPDWAEDVGTLFAEVRDAQTP